MRERGMENKRNQWNTYSKMVDFSMSVITLNENDLSTMNG